MSKRDKKTGRFIRRKGKINDKEWLYQKYVIEKLKWADFYELYGISLSLLQSRLKEFNLKRKRISWNKGTKGIMKKNNTSFKKGHKKGIRFGRDKNYSGEKHWNWKGGITPVIMKIRLSKLMKQWRKKVFKRDNYVCQKCGIKGGKLQAHHKISFSKIIKLYGIDSLSSAKKCDLLWNVNNGVTLCKKCHKKTKSYLNNSKKNSDGTNYYGTVIYNVS